MTAALQQNFPRQSAGTQPRRKRPGRSRDGQIHYLKVGEGAGGSAYALKSKSACEAARRGHDANWNSMIAKLKKQIGNRGTFAKPPRTRCMDTLLLRLVGSRVGV